MSAVLRPAEIADYDGIAACLQRNGMSVWSRERWLAIWGDYPHRVEFEGIPRGFVLEADGVIVGSISNGWARYAFQGRVLRAAVAGSAAVDPAYRAASIRLFGAQLLQAGIDLYLNGSASRATSRIMDTLKVRRVPQPTNDVCLLWAVRGTRFARAALERRRVALSRALAWPMGVAVSVASNLALRRAGKAAYPADVATAFSDDFDGLWQTVRDRTTRLIAFRDRATLQWRYGPSVANGSACVLTLRRGGLLAAYAVLMRRDHPSLHVAAYSVHDLQCADEDPALVGSLLHAAWHHARAAGVDLLEWTGFTGSKREIAERSSALRYRLDVWQAFYHAHDALLKHELSSPERWEFSPYDSD